MDWQRVIDLWRAYGDKEKANKWINELNTEIQDWHDSEAEVRAEQAYFDREWVI